MRALYITGHSDGKLCIWRYGEFIATLAQYSSEVTCLSKVPQNGGIVAGTSRGAIFLWDATLSSTLWHVDLQNLPFRLSSFSIAGIDSISKFLLFYSLGGDVV